MSGGPRCTVLRTRSVPTGTTRRPTEGLGRCSAAWVAPDSPGAASVMDDLGGGVRQGWRRFSPEFVRHLPSVMDSPLPTPQQPYEKDEAIHSQGWHPTAHLSQRTERCPFFSRSPGPSLRVQKLTFLFLTFLAFLSCRGSREIDFRAVFAKSQKSQFSVV